MLSYMWFKPCIQYNSSWNTKQGLSIHLRPADSSSTKVSKRGWNLTPRVFSALVVWKFQAFSLELPLSICWMTIVLASGEQHEKKTILGITWKWNMLRHIEQRLSLGKVILRISSCCSYRDLFQKWVNLWMIFFFRTPFANPIVFSQTDVWSTFNNVSVRKIISSVKTVKSKC